MLCDTFPAFDHLPVALGNAQARGTPEQFEALQRGLAEPTDDDRLFSKLWSAILPLYFHRPQAWDLDSLFAQTRFGAQACYRSFDCLGKFNVRSRLTEIRVPTLILNGADDWVAPVEQAARRLLAGIPGSELVIFEQSGHWPFIEEQERFQRVVSDWLAKLR